VDSSKQQQFNQWSDGHGNGAKTIAIAQLVTLMASAKILAPPALRRFDERFSDVNSPLSTISAASMLASVAPFKLSLISSSVSLPLLPQRDLRVGCSLRMLTRSSA
jgi:hypothetical protein